MNTPDIVRRYRRLTQREKRDGCRYYTHAPSDVSILLYYPCELARIKIQVNYTVTGNLAGTVIRS